MTSPSASPSEHAADVGTVWKWNDNDTWSDTDEVVLLQNKFGDLKKVKDMLHLSAESPPYLQVICKKAGLTAAPVKNAKL